MTPIVLCVDDGYARGAGVVLLSLASSSGDLDARQEVFVLDCGLASGDAARLRRIADKVGFALEVRRVDVPSTVVVTRWASRATYGRLLIPEVLSDRSCALYVDTDVLIVDSVRSLLEQKCDGSPVAAVRDAGTPVVACGVCLRGWDVLGIPGNREYFNSGVMLMDLHLWRELDLGARAFAFLREFPEHARCWDQDALNVILADDWKRLDLRWNAFPMSELTTIPGREYRAEDVEPLEYLLALEDAAAIIHFAGATKPWETGYPKGRWWARYAEALEELSLFD